MSKISITQGCDSFFCVYTYLKYAWIISWKATANGIESEMPMVSGDGPRDDPMPPIAVRNSKLPILSARFIAGDGLMRPRAAATEGTITISERREGGLGIAILLADVGVGICRLFDFERVAEAGAEALTSPNSENISPKSAYLRKNLPSYKEEPITISKCISPRVIRHGECRTL